jgi:hypothetical protein
VTLAEARVLLGVEANASVDDIRRAYLRLLKQCKPEADPEGFMRLRAAYDIVKQAVRSAPTLGADSRTSKPVAAAPAPAPIAIRPSPAPVATRPSTPAHEGTPAFTPIPLPPATDFRAMWDRGELPGAADVLRRAYEAACRNTAVPVPPFATSIDVLLTLIERGCVEPACALYDAAAKWLATWGNETTVLVDPLAARWKIVGALRLLPAELSQDARRAFVELCRGRSWEDVEESLHAYYRRAPREAAKDRAILAKHDKTPWAPAIARALAEEYVPSPDDRRKRLAGPRVALALVALFVPMIGAEVCRPSSPETRPAVVVERPWITDQSFSSTVVPRSMANSLVVEVRVEDAGVAVLNRVVAVRAALDDDDCPAAEREAAQLRASVGDEDSGLAVSPRLARNVEELRKQVIAICDKRAGASAPRGAP